MEKIKYLIKRIFNMNFKNMFNIINKTKENTKKSKIVIFFDMVWCGLKYQAGYMDYYLFGFYELSSKDRKTHMTRGINNKYIKYFNNPEYNHIFKNKDEFNIKFKKYLHRDFLILNNNEDEFNKFIKEKEYIICKPKSGSCGKGIEKIRIKDFKNKNLFNYLINKDLVVIEEFIKQSGDMNKMYPGSINTIRIVSILHNNKANPVVAYLRVGTSGRFVDNFNSGGMVVPVDIKTGEINFPAVDKALNIYTDHPDTKTKFIGFKIPRWDEILEMVKQASFEVKEMGMVGWDVAISERDVLLVEGNEYPGHDIYQLPMHRKDGTGVLKEFEKIIKLR